MAQNLGTGTLKQGRGRKLTKIPERRTVSMDLPERFRVDDEEDDAAQGEDENPETFVQQSMYGIIAAATSKSNFKPSLQPLSASESDSEGEGSKRASRDISRTVSGESSELSSADEKPGREKRPAGNRHRRNVSDSIRSFLKPIRERGDSQGQAQDVMSQSQILPPKKRVAEETERPTTAIRRDAPVMDQKLQARARANMDSSAYSIARRSRDVSPEGTIRKKAPVALPEALAEIFQFEEPEEVISEYACWYLQSVLLQGYMYITQKHVCFYAYLQKKGNVVKSGHLAKQGKRNPRYRRYYFTLKGDVLSYYASAAEPYFPSGTIDLRYAISAEVAPEKEQEKGKESSRFSITAPNRTYYFKADSPASAKEWVKQLQKVIFRSHNDGDSVKISLPLKNIVDVEPTRDMSVAETIKIQVIDSTQTFAIDDYFFSFFSHGEDALNVLTLMTQDNEAKKAAAEMVDEAPPVPRGKTPPPFRRSLSLDATSRLSTGAAPAIAEPVRSTLSPLSAGDRISPRISSEQGRPSAEMTRSSFDRGRSSFDRGRRSVSATSRSVDKWRVTSKSPLARSAQESSESFVTSSEHQEDSFDAGDNDMSASQMLSGDRMFGGPTLKMPQPRRTASGSTVERLRQESRELSSKAQPEEITIHPPSRTQTDRTLTASPTEFDNAKSEYFAKPKAKDAKTQSYDGLTSTAKAKKSLASPLQQAFNLAGAVRNQSKRMSSYLSSSPKGYLDKFQDAIAGGKRHYSEADGLAPDDRVPDTEDEGTEDHHRRFQQHFALPGTERLRAVYYCWLHRVLPLYGKIYISDRRFCFRSLIYGTRTKLNVPFRDILNVVKEKGFRWGYPGMVVVISGHEELFFDFGSVGLRDDCNVTMLRAMDVIRSTLDSVILTEEEKMDAEEAAAENEMLSDARRETLVEHEHKPDPQLVGSTPILFDDPNASVLDFRPKRSLNITCLTIGSRGDVQPYIALCKGLVAHGHNAKIATHAQFEGWIRKHGIDFAPVEGDPAELMRLCVENGMFTPSFVVEASGSARDWLDKLLNSSWEACQAADILIESPSAMSGIHIAEALGIPYFRAFTMPWTKTRAYPHAFAVPKTKQGGAYNYMTYVFFDNIFWQLTANQINRWRKKTLSLRPTDLSKLQINKVPFLYNFSPSVVVPPLDFSDWIRVTGYWFLDEGAQDWEPPADLERFIRKAREDNMKLVYIGFGSIPVSDSKQLTQQIVDAVLKADVRCIFSKGWSDHFDKTDPNAPALPDAIYQVRAVPHDWLFTQIDAAVHHGGAGTTGASLRAGLPTVIKPFFGDQFFFATRAEDLGVGVYLKKITVNALGKAIWLATHDERMRTKARLLGEQIRRENGVENAINAIYRDLEYAKTLIKKRKVSISGAAAAEEEEDTEESWTFVETDSDVDFPGARSEFNAGVQGSGKRLSLGSTVLNRGARAI